ncbi:MAG TPA: 3-hydroxybutyryl-CoA dehydrogenase [Actinocrinis sp.]|nr:3-hydroxybutyryl-CoA dehydrogenase [Actinocrinis sp.]
MSVVEQSLTEPIAAPAAAGAGVGIVGSGVMGVGLAETYARAGLDVLVVASRATSVDAAQARLARSLAGAVRRGKLTEEQRGQTLGRISFTADLTELADRRFVIEAVPEIEELKLDVFAVLDKVVQDDAAVLASNTSSIPITRLGRAAVRPERVVGLHFFNPVPAMPLVEVTGGLHTSADTLRRARSFVEDELGKQAVRSQDRAGFVVNALLIPYLLSAVRMLEAGFATAEDIDRGMTLGCGHPMGPLALCDLIGLDVVDDVAKALHEEFRTPHHASPSLLLRMVEAGLLGRKSGRGFFEYA